MHRLSPKQFFCYLGFLLFSAITIYLISIYKNEILDIKCKVVLSCNSQKQCTYNQYNIFSKEIKSSNFELKDIKQMAENYHKNIEYKHFGWLTYDVYFNEKDSIDLRNAKIYDELYRYKTFIHIIEKKDVTNQKNNIAYMEIANKYKNGIKIVSYDFRSLIDLISGIFCIITFGIISLLLFNYDFRSIFK